MKRNNTNYNFDDVYKVSSILCEIKGLNSDLRIGQLLYVFFANMKVENIDPFYMSDKQFVEEFEKWVNQIKNTII